MLNVMYVHMQLEMQVYEHKVCGWQFFVHSHIKIYFPLISSYTAKILLNAFSFHF